MVYFISSVSFAPHFGHPKVYETSVWTPCFQILAKTMIGSIRYFSSKLHLKQVNFVMKDLFHIEKYWTEINDKLIWHTIYEQIGLYIHVNYSNVIFLKFL